VPATGLFQIAQSLAALPQVVFLDAGDLAHLPKTRARRLEECPAIAGTVVLSCCHMQDGHWIFRVFNPSDKQESIRLLGEGAWEIIDMRGNNPERIGAGQCAVAPRQILTLRASAPVFS
jgi:hypothetical protein